VWKASTVESQKDNSVMWLRRGLESSCRHLYLGGPERATEQTIISATDNHISSAF